MGYATRHFILKMKNKEKTGDIAQFSNTGLASKHWAWNSIPGTEKMIEIDRQTDRHIDR